MPYIPTKLLSSLLKIVLNISINHLHIYQVVNNQTLYKIKQISTEQETRNIQTKKSRTHLESALPDTINFVILHLDPLDPLQKMERRVRQGFDLIVAVI